MLSSWVLLYYLLLHYAWHIGNLQEILAELITQLLYDEYLVSHTDFQAFKFHHPFHLIFDISNICFSSSMTRSSQKLLTTQERPRTLLTLTAFSLLFTLLFQYFLLFPNQILLLPLLPTPWYFLLCEPFLIIINLTVIIQEFMAILMSISEVQTKRGTLYWL